MKFNIRFQSLYSVVSVVWQKENHGITISYYTGSGFNLQAGYLLKNNLEVSARYTSIMPDTEVSFAGTKEYTLGLSKYIVGHSLKLQSDVSLFNPEEIGASNEVRYRFQMEFQF